MKVKRVATCVFSVIILVTAVLTAIFGNKSDSPFWTINISQLLTIAVAILIAFSASQFKSDERKLKESTEKLLTELQKCVNSDCFINPECHTKEEVLINNRRISNLVDTLKKCANNLSFSEEIKYIEEQFTGFSNLWGNHCNDNNYLKESKKDFSNYSKNIESKCDSIFVDLYL